MVIYHGLLSCFPFFLGPFCPGSGAVWGSKGDRLAGAGVSIDLVAIKRSQACGLQYLSISVFVASLFEYPQVGLNYETSMTPLACTKDVSNLAIMN